VILKTLISFTVKFTVPVKKNLKGMSSAYTRSLS
jgi:hypothetical protein